MFLGLLGKTTKVKYGLSGRPALLVRGGNAPRWTERTVCCFDRAKGNLEGRAERF